MRRHCVVPQRINLMNGFFFDSVLAQGLVIDILTFFKTPGASEQSEKKTNNKKKLYITE